ncbi:MAG: hypothetical protein HYU97_09855 [Deltaproteobacteria bacterium]|nr:hypothetical protein [Deltaproteobacteria bacterium]
MNLRLKLSLVLSSFVLIPFALTSYFYYQNFKNTITQKTFERLNKITSLTSHGISEYLRSNLHLFRSFASRPSLSRGLLNLRVGNSYLKPSLRTSLQEALKGQSDLKKMSVLDFKGKIIVSTDFNSEGKSYPLWKYLTLAKEQTVYFLMSEEANLTPRLYLAGPILQNGQPAGVLVIESGVENLLKILAEISALGNHASVALIWRDERQNALTFLAPTSLSSQQKGEFVKFLGQTNASANFIATKNITATPWIFAAKMNEEYFLREVNKIKNKIWILGGVILLILFISNLFLRQQLLKPLLELSFLTSKVREQHPDFVQPMLLIQSGRKDEIGKLALAIKDMTQELVSTQKALEEKVQHRTQALQKQTEQLIASRRAALNLVEDTLLAKKAVETTQHELQQAKDELDLRVQERTQQLKQSEERFKKANEELRYANQMKSAFISMVSHELRTPLSAMKSGIDIMLEEIEGPINTSQHETLTIAKRNIDRLARLISNVLDYSRLEAGKMEMFYEDTNLNEVFEEICHSVEPEIMQKNLHLIREFPLTSLIVNCDADKIKQVLLNLLNNAIKFTEHGTITARMVQENDMVKLEIEDTGVGIPTQDHEKIFEMFGQSLSRGIWKTGGSGVGLAVTRLIVQEHKGKIALTSEPGKGSVFKVWIPLDSQARAQVH